MPQFDFGLLFVLGTLVTLAFGSLYFFLGLKVQPIVHSVFLLRSKLKAYLINSKNSSGQLSSVEFLNIPECQASTLDLFKKFKKFKKHS